MSTSFTDLREWIAEVDKLGELAHASGADWYLEMGALTDLIRRRYGESCPSILFDDIKGYPSGHRVLTNPIDTLSRMALTLGLPQGLTKREYTTLVWERLRDIHGIPPTRVEQGPVFEHSQRGEDVDLYAFPAPHWHAKDGGRYIGAADCVVTRPPDGSWVNLGCYRTSIVDRNHLFVYISPGKHGRQHRDAWLAAGQECPVAISFGPDPLLWLVAQQSLPSGASEYDYTGGLRGEPVEVVEGPVTGLPFPARSELVVEGYITTDTATEGPFGEWTGYYASGSRPEYVMRVEAVHHRTDPIILGTPPGRPPDGISITSNLVRSAVVKSQLEAAGVPGVTDVCVHKHGGARFFVAISIDQRYPGHARQTLAAAASTAGAAYLGKYFVVVDDDIDVFDLEDVLWAMFTRTDPVQSIGFLERCWSGPLDPAIPTERKGLSSRALIDACRPWEWRDRFPEAHHVAPDLMQQVRNKWPELFARPGGRA